MFEVLRSQPIKWTKENYAFEAIFILWIGSKKFKQLNIKKFSIINDSAPDIISKNSIIKIRRKE